MTDDCSSHRHPTRSRTWLWGAATVFAFLTVGAAISGGCSTLADDCVEGRCWEPEGAGGSGTGTASGTGTGTASGTGTGTASGTGTGTGTGTTTGCAADAPPHDGGCTGNDDGIFVSGGGDDGSPGTREEPVQTIAAAISLADSQSKTRIFICAGSYDEAVVVPAGLQLHGGLDCAADWAWTGATTTVAPSGSGQVPLTLQGGGADATLIEDLTAIAPHGTAPGHSSVAMLASDVEAAIVRCSLSSGQGADGAVGADASTTPASSGLVGNNGANGHCNAEPVAGGAIKEDSHCGLGTFSGGKGGDGGATVGGNGVAGAPPPAGFGGPGQPQTGTWTNCPYAAANGTDGATGGVGAAAVDQGQLSAAGYQGDDGGAGDKGAIGRPGGGGGGARISGCSITGIGSGGGSGGTGGCGGNGGGGGGFGGSSIALISVNAFITLVDTDLVAGRGGPGGRGGNGQPGGLGGNGGSGGVYGSSQGCVGGSGGDGGRGGPGGGGRGGHSLGIAYRGTEPVVQGGLVSYDQPGDGGNGGDGNVGNNPGSSGEASDVLPFP